MARFIRCEEKGPLTITVGDETKHICRCGLSVNQPFCDGKHRQTHEEKEGDTYVYEDGKRRKVKELIKEEENE